MSSHEPRNYHDLYPPCSFCCVRIYGWRFCVLVLYQQVWSRSRKHPILLSCISTVQGEELWPMYLVYTSNPGTENTDYLVLPYN